MRYFAVLLLSFFLLFAAAGHAAPVLAAETETELDQNDAREALESEQLLPLEQIIKRMHQSHKGEVLNARLMRVDGKLLVYHIKLLTPAGKVTLVTLNARTGQLLRVE